MMMLLVVGKHERGQRLHLNLLFRSVFFCLLSAFDVIFFDCTHCSMICFKRTLCFNRLLKFELFVSNDLIFKCLFEFIINVNFADIGENKWNFTT